MANIISELPGIFYTKPSPDKDPFVSEGDRIEVGQTVGTIEVMKQFADVRSDTAGVVSSIEIENGTEVQPGAVLFIISED